MISIVLLLYLLFLSLLLGRKALGWLQVHPDSLIEEALFATGLGFGFLAYSTYLFGILTILYRPLVWLFVVALSLLMAKSACTYVIRTYTRSAEYAKTSRFEGIDVFSRLLIILLLLHLVLNLIGALAPEIGFDALWYHLSIPEIYKVANKITFIPHINLSGFPRLMEMLYTLGLVLRGEQLARLIHFVAGVLSAVGIFVAGRKFFGPAPALVATVIFYAMQPVNMLSATADIDLGLTLFGLLGLLALLNAIESKQTRWLLLGGLFAGLAASTKYQGALVVAALAFSLLFYGLRRDGPIAKWKASGVLAFGLIALLVFLPWPLDDFINTGNPVYPLLNKVFGVGESYEQVVLGSQHTTKSWFYNHTFTAFLTLPWRLITGAYDGFLSPLLLLLLPSAVFLRRKHWVFSFLLVFSLLLYTLLFLLPYWIVRFFVPLVPALSLMAAFMWSELGNFDKILKRLMNSAIVLVALANLAFLILKIGPTLPVSLGLESRDNYLSRTLGWYDVNRIVRKNLPSGSKILVYGAQLFYYFDFDYEFDQPMPAGNIARTVKRLRDKGISHILLLVDKSGPRNLEDVKGFEGAKTSGYFRLIYEKAAPEPARTNAARGARLYAVDYLANSLPNPL